MRSLATLFVCLCLASCDNAKYGDHPPYPTTGQVLVNGEPAKGALIVMHHKDDWGEKAIVPQAWTDDEGRFVMATYGKQDGAPAGDYLVTVEWPAYRLRQLGPDKLGGKFAKAATSGLTAHVEKGKNELPAFELQGKVTEYQPKKEPKK